MFEGFKKKFIAQPGDTYMERAKKNNNIDSALKNTAGAIGVGTSAMLGAVTGVETYAADHPQSKVAEQLQHLSAQELQGMQKQGPHGAVVSINPEAGTATVTMRPPGDGKPVSVDVRQPVTDIDPSVPVYDMKAPE